MYYDENLSTRCLNVVHTKIYMHLFYELVCFAVAKLWLVLLIWKVTSQKSVQSVPKRIQVNKTHGALRTDKETIT